MLQWPGRKADGTKHPCGGCNSSMAHLGSLPFYIGDAASVFGRW